MLGPGARRSLLILLGAVACADDDSSASGSSSSSEGSTTDPAVTTSGSPVDGTSSTGATGSTGESTGVDATSSTGATGSTGEGTGGTTTGEGTGSTGESTGSTGEEATGTTGEVLECEPTNPGGASQCNDGVVVAGELCYETEPPLQDAGTFSTRVWAGDLDGDADPDALALAEFPAEMVVLLGDGLGNLVPDDSYDLAGGVNTGSRDVAAGDMDGDTWVDAVVAFASPASLRVLTNDGGGAFAAPIVTMLPAAPNAVAVGDLDGDALTDAVVADAAGITVHPGLGNGTFGPATVLSDPALVQGRGLTMHDLDDDGDLDVAVAFSQVVAVYPNDGGALGAPLTVAVPGLGTGTADVEGGEVTGDGVVDLVVTDSFLGHLRVLVGAGDGSFALDPQQLTGRFAVVGDANADCVDDILTRTAPLMLDELTIYAADGAGGFAPAQTFLLHSGMVDMDGADFDGDGLVDVLFAIGPIGEVGVSLTEP